MKPGPAIVRRNMRAQAEWLSRIRQRKATLLGAATLAALPGVYWLAGTFGVPLLVRDGLAAWQAQVPSRRVTLGRASFNPWTLALTARQFEVRDSGRVLVNVDELRVDVSLSSLWKRAIIADEIELEAASVYMSWDANGHLDIERIFPHQPRRRVDTRASSGMPWEIRHLAITALRVQLDDPSAGLSEPLDVTLPRLEVERIGTLYGSKNDLTLNFHGHSEGKPVWDLLWRGHIDFAPFSSAGRVQLTHISLPWLNQTMGRRWPVQVRSGQADIDAAYELGEVQGHQHLIVRDAGVDVRQLEVRGTDHVAPTLSLREMRLQLAQIDTFKREVVGKRLLLETPELWTHRLQDGQLDLLRLMQQWPLQQEPATPAARAWSLRWPVAEVRSAAVLFDDQSPDHLGKWKLADVNLRVEDFDNQKHSALRITAEGRGIAAIAGPAGATAATGGWSVKGNLQARDAVVHASWALNDLDLGPLAALPLIKARADIRRGHLSANGQIDGALNRLDQAAISTSIHLREADVANPQFGEISAASLELGPLEVQGPIWRLKRLHSSQLKWIGASAIPPQLLGQQQDLTMTDLTWDRAKQKIELRDLQATGGDASLQNAQRTVRLRWSALKLHRATGNLATERFGLVALGGSDLSWEGRQPWLRLPVWELRNLQADGRRRRLELEDIAAQHGQLRLSLRRDGSLAPLSELHSVLPSGGPMQASDTGTMPAPAGAEPWDIHLHAAKLDFDSLRFRQGGSPLRPLTATQIGVRLGDWPGVATEPVAGHLQATLEGGQLRWDGTFSPSEAGIDGQLDVQHIDLAWLQPFLEQNSYAAIDRASASLSGNIALHGRKAHYEGTLSAGALRILDSRDQQPVLSWKSASIPEVRLDWPGSLQLGHIALDGLLTSVTIQPDHHINWEAMVRSRTDPTPHTQVAASNAGVRAAATQGPPTLDSTTSPWAIQLEQLSLTDSGIDFTDQGPTTPFRASIHALAGTIGPYDSQSEQTWTQVALKGRVNNYGHVEMTGRIMPLSKPLRTQANLHFSSIQLPTLNPYAAEIAGYRIERGMLDLKLQYTVQQGLIEGNNRARIEQLVLGPQVSKADGPDLPLQAIIDILRNDEGVIELDVPVRGNLNDPNVVMRDIAFKAVQGVLRKTIESPFTLVSSLFGGDEETLRHIGFTSGTADLTQHDQQKLSDIAQVLSQHKKLLMFIQPAYNAAADAPGGLQAAASRASGGTPPSEKGTDGAALALRALALRRAQAIKAALVAANIPPGRIYIDEPSSLTTLGKNGVVLTTLDLKVP